MAYSFKKGEIRCLVFADMESLLFLKVERRNS